jgi:tRNA A37 threonylcarbamoyladenosine synthetase subunit TsaC/SUA5/YrdC
MQDGNPFGIKDHTPFSGFSAELVYGLKEDGMVVHVSETVSGLKCNCRCPACERPVLAKKGKKQA